MSKLTYPHNQSGRFFQVEKMARHSILPCPTHSRKEAATRDESGYSLDYPGVAAVSTNYPQDINTCRYNPPHRYRQGFAARITPSLLAETPLYGGLLEGKGGSTGEDRSSYNPAPSP